MISQGIEYIAITAPGGTCHGCAGDGGTGMCKKLIKLFGGCDGRIFRTVDKSRYEFEQSFYGELDDKEGKYDNARLHNI